MAKQALQLLTNEEIEQVAGGLSDLFSACGTNTSMLFSVSPVAGDDGLPGNPRPTK